MRPIAILGAGLGGLSLAEALRAGGCRRPVVLVDRRTRWGRDRTWCTWATEPLPWLELASHAWPAWETRRGARVARQRSRRHPYLHLDSRAVYGAALARLDAAPGFELRAGERVLALREDGRFPEVVTTRETFEAELVVDATGPRGPWARARPAATVELAQRFLGWEVTTERPVFDPQTATLMDFLPGDGEGLSFLYVLPFAPDRALVEHTSIGVGGPAADARRAALAAHLSARGAGAHTILHEERGLIPMTTHRFPAVRGPRVIAAGAAAGAVRPSSGYAFTRTVRHAQALAAAILTGRAPPPTLVPAALTRLDAVFLHAIADRRDGGEALLWAIADGVDGPTFARFMTDRPTPGDLTRIVAALPTATMAAAAVGALARGHSLNGKW